MTDDLEVISFCDELIDGLKGGDKPKSAEKSIDIHESSVLIKDDVYARVNAGNIFQIDPFEFNRTKDGGVDLTSNPHYDSERLERVAAFRKSFESYFTSDVSQNHSEELQQSDVKKPYLFILVGRDNQLIKPDNQIIVVGRATAHIGGTRFDYGDLIRVYKWGSTSFLKISEALANSKPHSKEIKDFLGTLYAEVNKYVRRAIIIPVEINPNDSADSVNFDEYWKAAGELETTVNETITSAYPVLNNESGNK